MWVRKWEIGKRGRKGVNGEREGKVSEKIGIKSVGVWGEGWRVEKGRDSGVVGEGVALKITVYLVSSAWRSHPDVF